MIFVIDTNIISEIINDKNQKIKQKIRDVMFTGKKILINGISYYEIKRGLLSTDASDVPTKLRRFEQMCEKYGLILPDKLDIFEIASKIYANLRRRGKPIQDADIIIASIVLYNDFTLVSNDSDFNRIEDLKIENWLN